MKIVFYTAQKWCQKIQFAVGHDVFILKACYNWLDDIESKEKFL